VLVNNAGVCRNAVPFEDVPLENWRSMFEINTFGASNCVKAVIPHMKERRSGKIVIISSLAGEVGGIRTEASYAASKAANLCVMMSLAKYLGPWNITVNGVAPGVIDTDMTKALDPADISSIPLGRIGRGEDVGNAILFLTSDRADYLTGVMIDVNGGMHFR
jgi:NAD(P)-dependent dehydrogenase (short-subunit alcohol dehydrogenase family)